MWVGAGLAAPERLLAEAHPGRRRARARACSPGHPRAEEPPGLGEGGVAVLPRPASRVPRGGLHD